MIEHVRGGKGLHILYIYPPVRANKEPQASEQKEEKPTEHDTRKRQVSHQTEQGIGSAKSATLLKHRSDR